MPLVSLTWDMHGYPLRPYPATQAAGRFYAYDDERTQRNPGRMCRMAVVHKLLGIVLLRFIPGHQISQLQSLIVLVQLAIREHKILDTHLSVHPIHTRILQNCTSFPGFLHDSRAVIIAHFAGKCSDFNGF